MKIAACISVIGLLVAAYLINYPHGLGKRPDSTWVIEGGSATSGGAILPSGRFPTKAACEAEIERRLPDAMKTDNEWYSAAGLSYGCFDLLKEAEPQHDRR